MAYSQKPLLEILKAGTAFSENSVPEHIETVISNVFLFNETVYKVYKNDSAFFNKNFRDLSSREDRFSFSKNDFAWNHALSPSIYQEILPVAVSDTTINETNETEAEEMLIVARKINSHDILFEKIISNSLSKENCYEIGRQFAESCLKIQTTEHEDISFATVMAGRIEDVKEWVSSVEKHISHQESASYCDSLKKILADEKSWFENQNVMVDGDFHSHNAVFENGQLHLMDTYPPKEDWMQGHMLIAMYRIGVDIWALTGNKELFESFIEGFESSAERKIDRSKEQFFVLYVSLIAVSYLYMLSESSSEKLESAKKFHNFIKNI